MLTLTRKVGEVIYVGDDVQIVVREIRRNQVRIGVIAPERVEVDREEVYERKHGKADAPKRKLVRASLDLGTEELDAAPPPAQAAQPEQGRYGDRRCWECCITTEHTLERRGRAAVWVCSECGKGAR